MLRVIKDEVCVNRRRLRWITQFEALIIFTIIYAKTESNNCFIMYSISRKKKSLPARWLFAFHDTPHCLKNILKLFCCSLRTFTIF